MTETWLHSNRRVLLLASVPALLLGAIGLVLSLRFEGFGFRILGLILAVAAAALVIGLLSQMVKPRIAYRDREVLFYLRAGSPIAAPVEVVEAFFLGQGPAHVPLVDAQSTAAVNLVARLSQRAPQWAEQDVKPALGNWTEGYVTIRGAWCEPLNNEVIRRLNRRLKEIHDARDQGESSSV